ncbi:MAG TPA: hypothetical protein VMD08_11160, partial [Candidatus Baltobacteraceae bacterium]|nr:hypothetical protein [Candidatus Baltobacteraceae bacterium]
MRRLWGGGWGKRRRFVGQREANDRFGPVIGDTQNLDLPAVGAHDFLNDSQTKTGAFASPLGREEGFKNMVELLCRQTF